MNPFLYPLWIIIAVATMIMMTACHSADAGNDENRFSGDDAPQSLYELEERIRNLLVSSDGAYGVAFIDVEDPETSLFINADEWFHAASTMKTPVLIEVYRQALEGRFDLDDTIPVKNEFTSIADGSIYELSIDRDGGDALYEHLGSEMKIRELVYSMIVRSGNLATNLVIEQVGADSVNHTMREIGADGIRVLRGVEDMPAFEAGMNNETTARGLAVMYQRLAEGAILDDDSRNEVISILKDQHYRDMIPAGLPESVEIAHKTGSITGITHDSGIVFLPDGRRYVLVVLSKNLPEHVVGHQTGSEISRIVYEYMTSDRSGKSYHKTTQKPVSGDPLKGRIIAVDPGHGGTADFDDYRVGPAGEREEWINLRVALMLRDMLEEREAKVLMTRTEDVEVELEDRVRLAVEHDADVFVSVHHNATADPEVNFPIIYYHGNASENRASVLLAGIMGEQMNRYLFGGDAPVSVVSDHTIFPSDGTNVLRNSYGIPGVIVEASFFTDPEEEQRLRDPDYNQLEAEAYVMALEEFFSRRRPEILEKNSKVDVPEFEVFQEAERMDEEALKWKENYEEGIRLMDQDVHLEKALDLLTRSARSFPDSWLAGKAHAARAEIKERLGKIEEAETIRLRVREFYIRPDVK